MATASEEEFNNKKQKQEVCCSVLIRRDRGGQTNIIVCLCVCLCLFSCPFPWFSSAAGWGSPTRLPSEARRRPTPGNQRLTGARLWSLAGWAGWMHHPPLHPRCRVHTGCLQWRRRSYWWWRRRETSCWGLWGLKMKEKTDREEGKKQREGLDTAEERGGEKDETPMCKDEELGNYELWCFVVS